MNFLRKRLRNERLSRFSDKNNVKVVHEKIYRLNLESHYVDRSIENAIPFISISIVMSLNFIHIYQKIGLKNALGNLVLLSGHLKTALRKIF